MFAEAAPAEHIHRSSVLDVDFDQLSDTGLVRDHNEDSIGYLSPETPDSARERGWLFVLADGVGGHDRGEVASRMTVDSMVSDFRDAVAGDPLTSFLPRLIQKANLKVYEAAAETGPGGASMATTVVACALRFDRAVVAHVGDSRCYLIRGGRASLLTRDHTVPNEQLRMGLITTREASNAQTTNVLSRSLGPSMIVNVDVADHQVYSGDVLLLCSDGLHNSVRERDIEETLRSHSSLGEAAKTLVEMAKRRDGKDNISIQLIRVKGVERVGMYRGRHYKIR